MSARDIAGARVLRWALAGLTATMLVIGGALGGWVEILKARANQALQPWVVIVPPTIPGSPYELGETERQEIGGIPGVTRVLEQHRRIRPMVIEQVQHDTTVEATIAVVDREWLLLTGRDVLWGRLWYTGEAWDLHNVAVVEGHLPPGATGWISIEGRRYRVIGGVGLGGQREALSGRPTIYVPAGARALGPPSLALLVVDSTHSAPSVVAAEVRRRLRSSWGVGPTEPDPMGIEVPDQAVRAMRTVTRLMWGVLAAGMLVPAGLAGLALAGLMRLATIRRLPELGLRRSVGATRQQILSLVLQDALSLGLAGSARGIVIAAIGWGGLWAGGLPVACPWVIAVGGVALPPLIAVLFTLGPAAWAAHVTPWEASQGW